MSTRSIATRVPASHPALPGHFPGQPIVPGVVLLAMVHAQARARLGFDPGPSQWRRIKFLAPILPDQPFRIELDGDQHGFRFSLLGSGQQVLARGQCRHGSLA